MNNGTESLPNDPDQLKELVAQLQAQVTHQAGQINQLLQAIQLAKQQHFGTHSAKYDIDQLSFLFNEAEALADHESNLQDDERDSSDDSSNTNVNGHIRRKGKGGRKKLPDHFPRVEVIHTLDEVDCHCDHCQSQLEVMSQKSSEQLELIPLTVKVIRHIKKTYHCPNCNKALKRQNFPLNRFPAVLPVQGH